MKVKLLLLALLSYSYLNAQNISTKYSEAQDKLYIKYAKEIGINEKEFAELMKKDKNKAYKMFEEKFKNLPKYEIISIGNKIEKDNEILKELRVEEDFKELSVLNYQESDFYQIASIIKAKHEKWKIKGEFEKTDDYQKRIQDENNFIKNELFEAVSKTVNSNSSNGDYNINITPLEYNADKEILNYKFSWKERSVIWEGYIKVPPETAKQLKNGSGQLISSLKVKNAKQIVQFSYYNLIPFNLEYIHINGKSFPITITASPYGLSDGKKLFTKENLKINSNNYTGYDLVEYSNSINEKQVYINIDKQIESLSTTSKAWDSQKSNGIKSEINNLLTQKPDNSTLLKLEQKLKNREKKVTEDIFREADNNIKRMEEYSLEIKRGGYKKEDYLKAYIVNYNNTLELYNKAMAIDNTEEIQNRIISLNKTYDGVTKNNTNNNSNSKQNNTLKTLNKLLK